MSNAPTKPDAERLLPKKKERHVHVAFYEDGKLTDKCADCALDIRDNIHVELGETL